MKLFGFEISRIKAPVLPVETVVIGVTQRDWLHLQTSPSIYYGLPYTPTKAEAVDCYLTCRHAANRVTSATAQGADEEEAFQKALLEIEKTIGTAWRTKSVPSGSPETASSIVAPTNAEENRATGGTTKP
jgi:hypothetical protein